MIEKADLTKYSNKFTYAYLIALSIVAVFAIVSHSIISNIIEKSNNVGNTINIAGKQRMLAVRICMDAGKVAKGESAAIEVLTKNIKSFEQAHNALLLRNGDLGIDLKITDVIKKIYFAEPYNLDQHSKEFIRLSLDIISESDKVKLQQNSIILENKINNELIPALDEVVTQLAADSKDTLGNLKKIQELLLILILITLVLEAAFIFRPLVHKLQWSLSELLNFALHDALTGIHNRRYFETEGKRFILLGKRNNQNLTCLMIDIDFFKKINDTFGHNIGDEVIKKTASIINEIIRETDLSARIGGEEFSVLLLSSLANATKVANKILLKVSNAKLKNYSDLHWTISIGISEMKSEDSLEDITKRADLALYQAKNNGRNQVSVYKEQ